MKNIFRTAPAVFAVGENYQIMVEVSCPTLMWVEVGGEEYFDDSNGIIRSAVTTHRVTVPMDALDAAGGYTLFARKIIERKPYFSETEEPVSEHFDFHPVKPGKVTAYQIADAHNMVGAPVKACKLFEEKYGPIDLLILNGDVPDHSGRIENFHNIYEIAADVTGGTKPVIFSRGNHDTRGIFAENIADHTPVENGNSFYDVKLGDLHAILIDCGEDKDDSHAEYGHTVCCRAFRKRETKWLEKLLSEPGIADAKYRAVIAHNPFTWDYKEPFDIENETYSHWAKLLREKFKPEVFIAGHLHTLEISEPGSAQDHLGHPCKVVSGSKPIHGRDGKPDYFAGSGFIFDDGVTVVFNDSDGNFISETKI